MPRKPLWIALQLAFLASVVWFAGRAFVTQWAGVRNVVANTRPHWGLIILSACLVFVAYAVLIHVWRATLAEWESSGTLGVRDAARIWFVSNLGRYVPGKVWQIAAMGVLAQRRGISPVAATGSALLVNLANLVSGFVVVFATGAVVFRSVSGVGPHAGLLLAVILGVGLLSLPLLLDWTRPLLERLSRGRVSLPRIPARALWLAAIGTALAWVLYGFAFRIFAGALVARTAGAPAFYIAAYTGSYLVGYLALLAPGGLVVREGMLVASLTSLGLLTAPEAWLVAIASRLWLTVLETVPGLLFLLIPGERS